MRHLREKSERVVTNCGNAVPKSLSESAFIADSGQQSRLRWYFVQSEALVVPAAFHAIRNEVASRYGRRGVDQASIILTLSTFRCLMFVRSFHVRRFVSSWFSSKSPVVVGVVAIEVVSFNSQMESESESKGKGVFPTLST